MDFDKNICPVLNVDGVMATGKQYDLEINLPDGKLKKYKSKLK